MFFIPFRKKKGAVTTEPLVPEERFTRDEDDIELGGRSKKRGVKLPPRKKAYAEFPPQWHERQCVVTTWTYFSISTLLLVFFCPYGALLGIVGGSLYTCHCCRCCIPKGNKKGMKAAFCIHVFAFLALMVDIVSVVFLVAIGAFYLLEDCPFAESLCDLRSVVGLIVFGGAGLVLLRFFMALNVFLGMRDYRREIQREEMLEKRMAAELEERYKEYKTRLASKEKKKKKRTEAASDQPSTSSRNVG